MYSLLVGHAGLVLRSCANVAEAHVSVALRPYSHRDHINSACDRQLHNSSNKFAVCPRRKVPWQALSAVANHMNSQTNARARRCIGMFQTAHKRLNMRQWTLRSPLRSCECCHVARMLRGVSPVDGALHASRFPDTNISERCCYGEHKIWQNNYYLTLATAGVRIMTNDGHGCTINGVARSWGRQEFIALHDNGHTSPDKHQQHLLRVWHSRGST